MRVLTLLGILFYFTVQANGQDIMAVHIQGQVRVCNHGDDETKAKSLNFGPVNANQKLILGQNAVVRFIRKTGEHCEVTKAGVYNISSLNFLKTSESSFMSKLGGFIKSFLEAKHSSESKESYKNTVHAISRGDQMLPILNFPFTGILPAELTSIDFKWTHLCDTCVYELEVYEMASKSKLFSAKTAQKEYKFLNPLQYLLAENEYYWTVRVVNSKADVNAMTFKLAATNEYQLIVDELMQQVQSTDIPLQNLPKTMYIMKSLEEMGFENYAMIYGMKVLEENPNDEMMKVFIVSYYESLLKRQLESQY
ncbi:MAG: hypothetical protein IPM92_10230 [Saprospiraceae bacterium]|nr:hypothetical protein [Saprospiraceae bacterium]